MQQHRKWFARRSTNNLLGEREERGGKLNERERRGNIEGEIGRDKYWEEFLEISPIEWLLLLLPLSTCLPAVCLSFRWRAAAAATSLASGGLLSSFFQFLSGSADYRVSKGYRLKPQKNSFCGRWNSSSPSPFRRYYAFRDPSHLFRQLSQACKERTDRPNGDSGHRLFNK